MIIREATVEDAKGLINHVKAVLGSSSFTLTTLDEFKQSEDSQVKWVLEMEQQKNLILVAEENGKIIGDLVFFRGNKLNIVKKYMLTLLICLYLLIKECFYPK